MAAGVCIEGVSKVFERPGSGVHALRDVDLTVEAGEIVLLTGPSGCGKTTLLHMIAGHETPDKGTITVGGHAVRGPGPDRGIVFQQSGLFPWMSCRRNVEYGLRMRGVRARERHRRAAAALSRVGLEDVADRQPHEISGGQRQRVAIARALVVEPDVLLFDEPFASLDAGTRRRLAADVVRLWQALGMTVVWVEHDLYLAPVLADRVILFGHVPGRVLGELRIELPRPRSPADPQVLALGEWLHAWLESAGREEPRAAPPPGGRLIRPAPARWPGSRSPAPAPGPSIH